MSDIAELERRITAALERIGTVAERASEGGGDGESGALRAALEEEKTANAQLAERLQKVRDKQQAKLVSLRKRVDRLVAQVAGQEHDLQRLKAVNAQLRENNMKLREANADGLSDPHLVNTAMMAELDALRAAQAADRSELDAVLGELRPIVEEENA